VRAASLEDVPLLEGFAWVREGGSRDGAPTGDGAAGRGGEESEGGGWALDVEHAACDSYGWTYGFDWWHLSMLAEQGATLARGEVMHVVRRRLWRRVQVGVGRACCVLSRRRSACWGGGDSSRSAGRREVVSH
jgi:hypothetical protein